jgi:hypothetical protein
MLGTEQSSLHRLSQQLTTMLVPLPNCPLSICVLSALQNVVLCTHKTNIHTRSEHLPSTEALSARHFHSLELFSSLDLEEV